MLSDVFSGLCHLGVDIDTKNQFNLLKTHFNAKYMFPDNEIEVVETSKGFHITVHGVETSIKMRDILGDDSDRVLISEMRMSVWNTEYQDILFFEKTPKYGKMFRVKDFNILNYI